MLSCWLASAKLRPSFRQLEESVSNIVDKMRCQMEVWRVGAHYVNTADPSVTAAATPAAAAADDDDERPSISSQLDAAGAGLAAAENACRSTTV